MMKNRLQKTANSVEYSTHFRSADNILSGQSKNSVHPIASHCLQPVGAGVCGAEGYVRRWLCGGLREAPLSVAVAGLVLYATTWHLPEWILPGAREYTPFGYKGLVLRLERHFSGSRNVERT